MKVTIKITEDTDRGGWSADCDGHTDNGRTVHLTTCATVGEAETRANRHNLVQHGDEATIVLPGYADESL